MSKTIFTFTVIFLLAFTGLAQTRKEPRFFCNYGEGNRGAELCAKMQESTFKSNQHAERAVDMILKPLGLRRNFVLVPCPNIDNAAAVTYDDGVRYIVYDNAFMEGIDSGSNTDWASVSILAHEIGHHLQGHTTRLVHHPLTKEELRQSRENELEADEFSGFAMFKLGRSLDEAQAAMKNLRDVDDEENSTHPKRWRRLKAIEAGYVNAKSQQPIGDIEKQPSAEAYYSKGLDLSSQKNYREAAANFTEAIELNPNFAAAYYARGGCKSSYNDYQGAIEDYSQVIRLKPNDSAAYYARGLAKKYGLQDYRGAIEDYSQVIRLKPDDAAAYYARGLAKDSLGDKAGAYEDFRKACQMGYEAGCKAAK
jgi:tetratricopeptide (TPR) repeat protein